MSTRAKGIRNEGGEFVKGKIAQGSLGPWKSLTFILLGWPRKVHLGFAITSYRKKKPNEVCGQLNDAKTKALEVVTLEYTFSCHSDGVRCMSRSLSGDTQGGRPRAVRVAV